MSGSRRGRRIVTGALAAVLAATFVPAAALGALVARDAEPRRITYRELRKGTTVAVCDDGARSARVLRVRFLHFALRQGQGHRIARRIVLTPPRVRGVLRPGACSGVRIRLRRGVTLDPGDYPGLLVVTSTAGIVRVPVTLAGPRGLVAVDPALGPGKPVQLRAVRHGFPASQAKLADDGLLAVRVSLPHGRPQLPAVGALMATVFRGTQRAQLFRADGEPKQDANDTDLWLVHVRAQGLTNTGVYEGVLHLSGDAGDAGVPVEITVSDSAFWPVLAVIAGALFAFMGQLWIRNWRVAARWRRRLRRLEQEYGTARDALPKPTGRQAVPMPTREQVRAYTDKIREVIRRSSSWYAFLDSGSSEYRGIVDSLSVAEADARRLGAIGGVHGQLNDLAHETSVVDALVRRECADPAPACVTRARGLLAVPRIEVGGAVSLGDIATRHTAFLRRWSGLFHDTLRYERWRTQLKEVKRTGSPKLSDCELQTFVSASALLRKAEEDLFAASDGAELDRSGAPARLAQVEEVLRRLLEQDGRQKRLTQPEAHDRTARLVRPLEAPGAQASGTSDGGAAESVDDGDAARLLPALPVRLRSRMLSFVDLLVLLFSVAVGLLATLALLYFGKTFGSTEDYLAAFGAGATSQLILSSVIERLDQMKEADRETVLVSDPQPAKLEVG